MIFAVDLFRRKPFSRSCPPLQDVIQIDCIPLLSAIDSKAGGAIDPSVDLLAAAERLQLPPSSHRHGC
jgi:hypothetical protein